MSWRKPVGVLMALAAVAVMIPTTSGVASAHVKCPRKDARGDSGSRLDIKLVCVAHTKRRFGMAVEMYERWNKRALGPKNSLYATFDTKADGKYNRLVEVVYRRSCECLVTLLNTGFHPDGTACDDNDYCYFKFSSRTKKLDRRTVFFSFRKKHFGNVGDSLGFFAQVVTHDEGLDRTPWRRHRGL